MVGVLIKKRGLTQVAWPTTCTTSLNGHLSGQEQGAANLAGENRADAPIIRSRSLTCSDLRQGRRSWQAA